MIDGAIRADGSLSELTTSRTEIVSLATDDLAAANEALGRIDGVLSVAHDGADGRFHTFRLALANDADVGEAVYEAARERGWPLRELRRDDKTLEQVFRELTESAREVAA